MPPSRYPRRCSSPSFEHDRETYGPYVYPGLAEILGARGIATLRFDLRGRGESLGAKPLEAFTPRERARLSLDVRAALDVLADEPRIDAARSALVAEGQSAEAAVRGWGGDERVRGLVLLSGRLSANAHALIEAYAETPLMLIASKEARGSFRELVEAYKRTASSESRILVNAEMGVGTTMFGVWRFMRPEEAPLEERIAAWLEARFGG